MKDFPGLQSVNNDIAGDSPIKFRHLAYGLFILVAIVLSVAIALFDNIIIIALVVAAVFTLVIFIYPSIGLALFILLSFLRPSDLIPSLEGLPLAKVVGGATLLAIIIKYIQRKNYIFNYRQTYLLAAFTGVLFISIPLSVWAGESSTVALDFVKMILFYLIFINVCRDLKMFRIMTLIALVCAIILCISTIQLYFTDVERAGATIGAKLFGDANDAALLFVSILPFSGLWISSKKFRFGKLFYGLSIAILVAGVILTQSRGGFLGLLVVLFVLYFRGKNKIKAIVSLAVIALIIQFFLPSKIGERYSTIGTYQEDASAMGRITAWKAGLKMMAARPLTGVGVGCFSVAYGTQFGSGGRWMAPHNTFIQVGAETGLIGLTIFILLLTTSIAQLRRIKSPDPDHEEDEIFKIRDMIIASILGFIMCAFFLTQALNFMLYYLIAASVSLSFIFSKYEFSILNQKEIIN
jgi:putative inorganic carbon (hco3(-)) transporter